MTRLTNIAAVARREFSVRVRTRSFIFGTLVLLLGVFAIAFAPIVIRAIDQGDEQRLGVHVSATGLGGDPVAMVDTLVNAQPVGGMTGAATERAYVVVAATDLASAREAVMAGDFAAVLEIRRGAVGDLDFVLYTNDNAGGRTAGLLQQAATAVAVADRLDRLGVAPSDQAGLFQPASFSVAWPDPARTDPVRGAAEMIGQDMLAFGMTVLIFMMIILYGTWIAMSVVEEKSSRVMEVILNAATPFQLLTGKVLGVGGVALIQYLALLATGGVALVAQGPVAEFVLGAGGGSVGLPQGLTISLLLFLGVYGILGFLFYAVLYAAAGSLVSRQEDVNTAVMPMTLVSTAGYLVGIYAAMGLLDIRAGWIAALSQVPFVSPFMMLGRITTGEAGPWEVVVSIGLLLVGILAALWLAARIYSAGVLLYGQRPGIRTIVRLVRSGA